jgi:histone acetyltransferase (RNA polymerase elongator complex component)
MGQTMIIPFFLLNRGCPGRCLFCNERLTAGAGPERIEPAAFTAAVRACLSAPRRRGGPVQIAFYGGTFTGLPRAEQRRLLALAAPFLNEGSVGGIRLSTRPDEIDREGLAWLKAAGVTTVELGAQSLSDAVLRACRRGHDAAAVVRAVTLLKEAGFETGLHLMAGLPGETPGCFAATIDRVIALKPHMVRIHPTLVLRDTPLAELFRSGAYRPLSLPEAVDLCKEALKKLAAAGIPVIRLGLQGTRELEAPGAVVAGPYHPAFGSLVEGALLGEMAAALWSSPPVRAIREPLAAAPGGSGGGTAIAVSPADLSAFLGPGRANAAALQHRCGLASLAIVADPALPRGFLTLTVNGRRFRTDRTGRITPAPPIPLHPAGGHGRKG